MIGYEEMADAVVRLTPEERDAFFHDNDISLDDMDKISGELAMAWIQDIPEGAMITAPDLHLALKSLFLIGFETAWRLRDSFA